MSFLKKSWLPILQFGLHAGALAPLAILVFDLFAARLSVNPIQDLTRRTGLTALIILLISLACTPASSLFSFRQALKLRRPLGLYAFFYAAFHLLLFVWADYRFDFALMWLDVSAKAYIFAGAGAFLILLSLAITSYNIWKKRLGKSWKRLHRLVYLAAILVGLHYAWVKKADFSRLTGEITGPLIAIGVLALLLLVRIPAVRKALAGWIAKIGG
jgi:sulfoxide reductase heme-binding subunit YedZ